MSPYRLLAVWPPVTLGALAVLPIPHSPAPLAAALGAFALLMVLDARARLAEFDQAVRSMRHGETTMLCWLHRTSWCQREMMKAAAASIGRRHAVETTFEAWGYRWFHIFPDDTFSRECPFLTMRFWRGLLGLTKAQRVPQ